MLAAKEKSMRVLTTSILIGSFILIGAPPEASAQSVSPDTHAQSVAGSDSEGEMETYLQKARQDMQRWQQKLYDFGEKAKKNGHKEGASAENDLNAAWTNTRTEAHKLQTVGTEGWDKAKISFENASHELARDWDRIRPENK